MTRMKFKIVWVISAKCSPFANYVALYFILSVIHYSLLKIQQWQGIFVSFRRITDDPLHENQALFYKTWQSWWLSDDEVIFVYNFCYLDKKQYSSPMGRVFVQSYFLKMLTGTPELMPNSHPILMVLSWYQSSKRLNTISII